MKNRTHPEKNFTPLIPQQLSYKLPQTPFNIMVSFDREFYVLSKKCVFRYPHRFDIEKKKKKQNRYSKKAHLQKKKFEKFLSLKPVCIF